MSNLVQLPPPKDQSLRKWFMERPIRNGAITALLFWINVIVNTGPRKPVPSTNPVVRGTIVPKPVSSPLVVEKEEGFNWHESERSQIELMDRQIANNTVETIKPITISAWREKGDCTELQSDTECAQHVASYMTMYLERARADIPRQALLLKVNCENGKGMEVVECMKRVMASPLYKTAATPIKE